MPGSNWNSMNMDDLMSKFGWKEQWAEKIDKSDEFKEFEDVIDNTTTWWKESFVRAVSEDQNKVLNLFDSKKLDDKIKNANNSNKSKDVQNAYKALWAYKAGKVWAYNQVLEQVEGEQTLAASKQKLLKMIDKNNDWNKWLKETAKTIIEDLFAECDSVEEFERRAWTRLSTIEGMDNIWDFFRSIPEFLYKVREKNVERRQRNIEFMREIWFQTTEIAREMIKRWIMKWNEFVDLCKEEWEKIEDMVKTVCEWGEDQLNAFVNYLNKIWEDMNKVLNAIREWTWKQWDKVVDLCKWSWEQVKAFWISLVQKWELMRNALVDSVKDNLEKAKDICKTLLEAWLVKFNEFVDRCKWVGEKGKDILIWILEWNKSKIKDFVNWCSENWNDAKQWFWDICKSLLEKWKLAISEFVDRCKDVWDKVKEVACNVLVWLVKAGKLTMRVLFDALIVIPAVTIMEISKLLIAAWKEIYKWSVELAKFIADLAVAWWEKAKQAWIAFGEFMWWVLNQIKELWIKFGNVVNDFIKSIWEWVKALWVNMVEFVKSTCDFVRSALWNAWQKTAEAFRAMWIRTKDVIKTIYEVSKQAWNGIVDAAITLMGNVKSAIDRLRNVCKMWIDKIWTLIMNAWKKVVEFINYAKELWLITLENIKKWCNNTAEKIVSFVRTAIEKCKATWSNLVEWFGGKMDALKDYIIKIYWNTKEWIKNFIRFIWWTAIEAWKTLLKLWVYTVWLVIFALKELWEWLANVAKMCVETLVKYWKLAVNALCNFLSEAYWKTKEMFIKIWQTVAQFIKESAQAIRNWILEKTKDAVQAIKAMEAYIQNWVKEICNWLYEKWLAVKDIAKTIMVAFKWQVSEIFEWIKAFYDICKNKLNLSWSEFKRQWNSGVQSAADYLTID